MVKERLTKTEAQLLKAAGHLVVDEDWAGPEITSTPKKPRSESFGWL